MRIECWPRRSPARASSRFAGGARRSLRPRAVWSMSSFRSACFSIPLKRFTNAPIQSCSVARSRNDLIMRRDVYTVASNTSSVQREKNSFGTPSDIGRNEAAQSRSLSERQFSCGPADFLRSRAINVDAGPRRSLRRPAAVEDERRARHQRGGVAGEEDDGAGQFLELPEAAELDLAQHLRAEG